MKEATSQMCGTSSSLTSNLSHNADANTKFPVEDHDL